MASPKTHLGHRNNRKLPAGTIIVLINSSTHEVIAACTLENWIGTNSPCRPKNFLDADLYVTDERARAYNEFYIKISDLRLLVGGDVSWKNNNLWTIAHSVYAKPFLTATDQTPVTKYIIWARSLV